jgi:PelA/Pel-15E family pectate lyase
MKRVLFSLLMIGIVLGITEGDLGQNNEGEKKKTVSWKDCFRQKDAWYGSDEAVRVADNVLLYQRQSGGWPKNIDMARLLSEKDINELRERKNRTDSTIDNGATYTQMRYLARVYDAAQRERFKNGFLAGLDYLLEAQYPNGGWPQFYPKPRGYSRHITFNDNAMIGAMRLLRDIGQKKEPFGFVDEQRRKRANAAVEKGTECILKCQITVDGKKLGWCAQHDEKTFVPRPARSYEKASLSGGESVGIVEFLMEIEKPGPEIIAAVQSAVAWFDQAKITGIRRIQIPAPSTPKGRDKVVIEDPDAPPLWARFHEIGTNRPIFCSRDGVIRYKLSEISYERRNGYSWYTGGPRDLLEKSYPAWQKKWAPDKNVLQK